MNVIDKLLLTEGRSVQCSGMLGKKMCHKFCFVPVETEVTKSNSRVMKHTADVEDYECKPYCNIRYKANYLQLKELLD